MRPKSKKPKKQRKYEFTSPKHEIHKIMSASLSTDLRASQGFRSLPVAAGDNVVVVRGKHAGHKGKITRLDMKKHRVFIDKLVGKKTDNTEVPIGVHPSNLVITKYIKKDRRRMEMINRRIKDDSEKIDIESVLAQVEEEETEDVIDMNEEDLDDDLDEDLDEDLELVEDETDEVDEVVDEVVDEEVDEVVNEEVDEVVEEEAEEA